MKSEADNLAGIDAIRHGFFSARGGVSTGIYESLNCGVGSKDDSRLVAENRRRVAGELGVEPSHLLTPWQVHSPTALIIDGPWPKDAPRPRLDALVTRTPGLAVGVLTADCAPVLFCDPVAKVVAAAHAGWRGAVGGVLNDAIDKMRSLGATCDNIAACVGPCISWRIYEVGDDFRRELLQEDPSGESFFAHPVGARKAHFDLSGYVAHRLEQAGLRNVEALRHCTFLGENRYFSFRRSQKDKYSDYGRQISAIVIG